MAQLSRGLFAVDVCEMALEDVRRQLPALYQWLIDQVKPEETRTACVLSVREKWWIYGEPRFRFRQAAAG